MKQKIGLVCGVLLIFVCLSCGKVTQVTKQEDEIKSFDLSAVVEVCSTADIQRISQNQLVNANDYISVLDTVVYAQICGIKRDGKKEELSWGRAELMAESVLNDAAIKTAAPVLVAEPQQTAQPMSQQMAQQMSQQMYQKMPMSPAQPAIASVSTAAVSTAPVASPITGPQIRYNSVAFRKDGVRLNQADHTWTKLTYDTTLKGWKIESKKIERGYPMYLVRVFVDKNKYYLKLIEAAETSGNALVSLATLRPYDTFLAVLFLMDLEKSQGNTDTAANLNELTQIFSPSFFDSITYEIPDNAIRNFNPKNPVWVFNRQMEQDLLKIYSFVDVDDKQEGLRFIRTAKFDWLNDGARNILLKNFEAYIIKSRM